MVGNLGLTSPLDGIAGDRLLGAGITTPIVAALSFSDNLELFQDMDLFWRRARFRLRVILLIL